MPPRRSRLKRKGKCAEREQEALDAFRRAIWERCGVDPDDPWKDGLCERCHEVRPIQCHHRLTNPRIHDAAQGHGLCYRCHVVLIHGHLCDDWADWVGEKKSES